MTLGKFKAKFEKYPQYSADSIRNLEKIGEDIEKMEACLSDIVYRIVKKAKKKRDKINVALNKWKIL